MKERGMEPDFGIRWDLFKLAFPLLFRGGDDIIDLGAGIGWNALIWALCLDLEALAAHQKQAGDVPLEIRQVKQKLGFLRFYVRNGTPEVFDLIHRAEEASARLCECYGEPASLHCLGGWYSTVCERHAQEARATLAANDPAEEGPTSPTAESLWGEDE